LFGRLLLARSDPAAIGELRAALAWSADLDGPRTGRIADLLRSLGVEALVEPADQGAAEWRRRLLDHIVVIV
jgi:hypothetical protein